jgi:hypothetical protein
MNISLISIYIGGGLSLLMVVFHTQFSKIFNWQLDFKRVSNINRRIIYTIHIALYLLFIGFSFISFVNGVELSKSIGLAFGINLIYSLLWLWRTIWQVVYLKPEKKNKFYSMHIILIVVFFLLFISYSLPIILRFI